MALQLRRCLWVCTSASTYTKCHSVGLKLSVSAYTHAYCVRFVLKHLVTVFCCVLLCYLKTFVIVKRFSLSFELVLSFA